MPVVSHDEFGLIAQQTNQMIRELRQKARIEKAFGKYMSPQIGIYRDWRCGEYGVTAREFDQDIAFNAGHIVRCSFVFVWGNLRAVGVFGRV